MGTQQKIKLTVEHLSVLYWLWLLDKQDVEDASTLGEKYFRIALDSIGIEQAQFDKIVTELADKGLMIEIQSNEYYLAFTDTGVAISAILEKLDKLRALGFRTVSEIKDFMIAHKDEIIQLIAAFGPTAIEFIFK